MQKHVTTCDLVALEAFLVAVEAGFMTLMTMASTPPFLIKSMLVIRRFVVKNT